MTCKTAATYRAACQERETKPTWVGLGVYAGREAAKGTAREYFAECLDNGWTPNSEGLEGMFKLTEGGHRRRWAG